MNYSLATTIRRLLAPQHELSCSRWLWGRLVRALRERGRGCSRESGAFLLGTRSAGRVRIAEFVLYDDLDPHCLDTGIVRFDGRYYGALWAHVERTGNSVVADVHVHPSAADQSESDRRHPMIAQPGHIAVILPNFAQAPLSPAQARAYVFGTGDRWRVVPVEQTATFFHVGII